MFLSVVIQQLLAIIKIFIHLIMLKFKLNLNTQYFFSNFTVGMGLLSNSAKVMNISFSIRILNQNPSILPTRKIHLEHVINFYSQSQ